MLFDYNRDGLTDIASINTNAPKLVLFKNEVPSTHRFAVLRFEGGNTTDQPSPNLSNRDGYGTRVTLEAGGITIVEELRAGEGFSAQNSRTLLIGLGDSEMIETAIVRWPSGREQRFKNLPVEQIITFKEGIEKFDVAPYQ